MNRKARGYFFGAIVSTGCSGPIAPVDTGTAAIGSCTLPEDYIACEGRRSKPLLPKKYEVSEARLRQGHDKGSWDPDKLVSLAQYQLQVCIDAKGVVLSAETPDEWGLFDSLARVEPGTLIYARKRFLLDVSVMRGARPPERDAFAAHVSVAGPNSSFGLFFVHDRYLPNIALNFFLPGSRPPVEVIQPYIGHFVVPGSAVVDGWIQPGRRAFFVVTPAEKLDVEISTSPTGVPVGSRGELLDDSAFNFGLEAGGPPPPAE